MDKILIQFEDYISIIQLGLVQNQEPIHKIVFFKVNQEYKILCDFILEKNILENDYVITNFSDLGDLKRIGLQITKKF